ncbi:MULTISPECIES: energy transducer TonB [unclassified Polaromonas]|uniref:energy transducer TonB n=1 Tax=unclassified Polaromonas TaxID=2638319 RepID=UPI000F087ABB|nr:MULTISPECIES: energy transducer TonB [unclassified Polaromonas]AYQ29186.1 energy transducer TonB [Polaromonas sp. SP1]QGJ19699.1 TonB family protein [Polaromonas sp. Pch-P]
MPATAFSSAPRPPAPRQPLSRNAVIALVVVGLHVAFIWALQSGLLMRAAEVIVPAEILTQFVDPPAPKVEPVPPTPPTPPVVQKKAVAKAPVQPAPQPLAITDPTPSPNAPTGVVTPPLPPAPVAVAPVAPPSPPAVQLPSSDADYLQNPKPPYPPISKRLGEQGKVIVRVLIGADGLPQKSEIRQSSGFDRLDQAAVTTVMRWRYVPGKRGGVPEAMWFNVPINFVLE